MYPSTDGLMTPYAGNLMYSVRIAGDIDATVPGCDSDAIHCARLLCKGHLGYYEHCDPYATDDSGPCIRCAMLMVAYGNDKVDHDFVVVVYVAIWDVYDPADAACV